MVLYIVHYQEMYNKKLKKIHGKIMQNYQELASKSFITQEIVEIEREKLLSSIKLIETEYLAACSVYVDGNIHARRDEMNGAHVSLVPTTFKFEVDDFSDLKSIALKSQRKS